MKNPVISGTYCVKAAESDSPFGPFTYYGDVLKASEIADGPGHNSAFLWKGKWFVAYHRRTIGDSYSHNRYLCIDELPIANARLQSVTMA